ncbi:MAG: ABC transporter ATP-binding protein [Candidatus Dormibacteraceae bacterium]
MTNRLDILSLGVTRGGRRALDDVHLALAAGECLGVAGPNGAGKSTLLEAIAGSVPHDRGEVRVDGEQAPLGRMPAMVGYAPQQLVFYPKLTGRENLRLFGSLYELSPDELTDRINELISDFDLGEWADLPAAQYSGGIGRRLHLALAIVHRPRLLLLDEPTVGLDPASRHTLLHAIRQLLLAGTAVVLTSQILGDLEFVATQVMILREGRVAHLGDIDELLSLMGSSVIDLECVQHTGARASLDGVPGVLSWDQSGGIVTCRVQQAPVALPLVLARLQEQGLVAARIEIQPPSLEQFLADVGAIPRGDA